MGGAAAIKFAKEGFQIAAMTRSVESFAPTEEKLAALGATYKHFPMDCTDAAVVTAAFTAVEQEFGSVTVLVYNAGGGGFGIPVLQIDPEAFMQSFNMSCVGALLCTQAVLPGMIAREGGDGKDSHRVKKKVNVHICRGSCVLLYCYTSLGCHFPTHESTILFGSVTSCK